MTTRADIIAEAVQAGLNAVDFCGNATEAIRQVADDNDTRFTADELASIRVSVYGEWNQSRTAAGVKVRKRAHYTETLIFGR